MSQQNLHLWFSSLFLALLVLLGYRLLEEKSFLAVVTGASLAHILTALVKPPARWMQIFASQTFVAAASICAVLLHITHFVGSIPDGTEQLTLSFLVGSLASAGFYRYIALQGLLFLGFLALLFGFVYLSRLRSRLTVDLAMVVTYVASTANLAFSYSLERPLYHVSGDPEARSFFFVAGIFGLESALSIHLFVFMVCLWWSRSRSRKA